MIGEHKQLVFIVWSVLVLPLIAAVFTFGIFMIAEFDLLYIGGQLVTPPVPTVNSTSPTPDLGFYITMG